MKFLKKLFKRNRIPKENKTRALDGPKYIFCFPDKENPYVPYYRVEGSDGKWVKAPYNGSLYYDPIEDSIEFKKIVKEVDELVEEAMREFKGVRGSCHRAWNIKKRLLLSYYGVEWHSVAELNPMCIFD